MDTSDPYRGTNPLSLTRYLRAACTICPVCGRKCSFDISFDPDSETIRMTSSCGVCGKTDLTPYISEDGDLAISFSGGKTCEPDARCRALKDGLGESTVAGADRETLGRFSEMAERLSRTHRPSESVKLSKKIADEYRSHIGQKGWDGAEDLCLGQATAAATVCTDSGLTEDASEIFSEYLDLAEERGSAKAFAFLLARAFCMFSEGDAKEPASSVRKIISSLDRMKAEGRIPEDDPLIRSRAYEALGVLLSVRNDRKGAAKAFKKALEDSRSVIAAERTEDGLEWMNRCGKEYASVCFSLNDGKHGNEALKESVRICARYKEEFPLAYADALLEKAMAHIGSGSELPPHLRKDMTDAIDILEKTGLGRYTHLPNAYYYRSLTGPDKNALDLADLGKAEEIVMEGLRSGSMPDSAVTSVMDTYVAYLEKIGDPRADGIRRELAEEGIWIHPPIRKKAAPEKSS